MGPKPLTVASGLVLSGWMTSVRRTERQKFWRAIAGFAVAQSDFTTG